MEAENPLDAWGTGIDGDAIFLGAFAAFADDPEVGVSVFCVDMTHQGEPYNEGYLQISIDRFEATDKPFCVLSNLASAVSWDEAKVLRDRGIPVLEGTDSGLRALRHLLRDAAWRARPPAATPAPVDDAVRERWRARLSDGAPMSELDGLALLADYGLPVVAARPVATAADAIGGRGRDRVPRRGEDGRTGHHAQVRCRRRPHRVAPTPTRSATRTRTSPDASVPRPSSPRWCPRGSRSRSVSSSIRRSVRWCWSRRAACSWRCCTTDVSRSRRSTRTRRGA